MKTVKTRLLAACAAALVLLAAGTAASGVAAPLSGRYLRGGGQTHILIDGSGTPVVLSDKTGGGLFDGLSDGDRIWVLASPAAETYPARAGAYFCLRLGSGSAGDLPGNTLRLLVDLGWLALPSPVPGVT